MTIPFVVTAAATTADEGSAPIGAFAKEDVLLSVRGARVACGRRGGGRVRGAGILVEGNQKLAPNAGEGFHARTTSLDGGGRELAGRKYIKATIHNSVVFLEGGGREGGREGGEEGYTEVAEDRLGLDRLHRKENRTVCRVWYG